MYRIRQSTKQDISRIAEIIIVNYRINFYPIFKNDDFYFKELQVVSLANEYILDNDFLSNTYVYDDGIIKGIINIKNKEIKNLFVEPSFQNLGIGDKLLNYAIEHHNVNYLWALEKNFRAIKFYKNHGFYFTGDKKFEDDTNEYLIKLER